MHLPLQRTGGSTQAASLRGDHAVVLGGSMSGLLAARVLADTFSQVTVVERDRLPDDGRPRRGVPHARHAHLLLPRGAKILDELFPGLLREMVLAGVPVADTLGQIYLNLNGHEFFHDPHAAGARQGVKHGALYQPSRPFLDAAVLRRVRALPNVEILDGCDVAGLTADETLTRVTGARVVSRDDSPVQRGLAADLVVAATGRGARPAAWLRGMGYDAPPREEVAIDLQYVTQQVRFPAGSVDRRRSVLVGGKPGRPTAANAFAQEGGTWVVTLAGYGGHHPPLEREGWLAFADKFLPRDFAEALHEAEPVDDLYQHRFPSNVRRRYDRLPRFPEGFLVIGEALCSTNPVYGQGIALAGLEALALRDVLRFGSGDLARRFFRAVAKPSGEAWRFAVGADLAMPASVVRGPRTLSTRAVNSYIEQVRAAAEHDPVMAWRFLDVTGFDQRAGALLAPSSLRRMAQDRRHHRRTVPARLALAAAQGQVWP